MTMTAERKFTMSAAEKKRQEQRKQELDDANRHRFGVLALPEDLPAGHEHIDEHSTLADLQAASEAITEAKRSTVLVASRKLYVEGRKFRVARPGARLEAILVFGETSWGGWSTNLAVGEIVECTGWQPGWQTPEVYVASFHIKRLPYNAVNSSVWPLASLFRPYPFPGYLEPVEEEAL